LDTQEKELKKLEDNKHKVNKFVNEVVGINEALVGKINLLQDKERFRLQETDSRIKNLLSKSNSTNRLESPLRRTPSKSNNSNRGV